MCSLFVFLLVKLNAANSVAHQFKDSFNFEVERLNAYKTLTNFYTSNFIFGELNIKENNVICKLHDSKLLYRIGDSYSEILQANLLNTYKSYNESNIAFKYFDRIDLFLFQDVSGIHLVEELTNPLIKFADKKTLIIHPFSFFEYSLCKGINFFLKFD